MMKIPYGLLRYQGPMLRIFGRIFLRAIWSRPTDPNSPVHPITRQLDAIPDQLVDAYLQFCNAAGKYPDHLPPHLVSHWGLPVAAELLQKTRFSLPKILNQGVTLVVRGNLPRNQPLQCSAYLHSLTEDAFRTRITLLLKTGTSTQPDLVETQLHMVIIHQRSARQKTSVEEVNQAWESKGRWRADDSDGLRFALITGDFNPIHWLSWVGKLSALGGKILHGFATFARSYEVLNTRPISQIDFRFVRPVPLPSQELIVEQASQATDNTCAVRLTGPDGSKHLIGSVAYH